MAEMRVKRIRAATFLLHRLYVNVLMIEEMINTDRGKGRKIKLRIQFIPIMAHFYLSYYKSP